MGGSHPYLTYIPFLQKDWGTDHVNVNWRFPRRAELSDEKFNQLKDLLSRLLTLDYTNRISSYTAFHNPFFEGPLNDE